MAAARLIVNLAEKSAANNTRIKIKFKGIKEDMLDWLKKQLKDAPTDEWSHANGVGSTIRGKDGSIWGRVVADEGKHWKLEGGRIAKKATEGEKWDWDTVAKTASGVGARILGPDWSVWGTVVADEGSAWKLDTGRVAKKNTEGQNWYWET